VSFYGRRYGLPSTSFLTDPATIERLKKAAATMNLPAGSAPSPTPATEPASVPALTHDSTVDALAATAAPDSPDWVKPVLIAGGIGAAGLTVVYFMKKGKR